MLASFALSLSLALATAFACTGRTTTPADSAAGDDSATSDGGGSVTPDLGCPVGALAQAMGRVSGDQVLEASGLALSRRQPGVLWTHNDSGDTARVFALDSTGQVVGEVQIAGANAHDWEDMAVGPGPDGGDALYMGDIGDNGSSRDDIHVWVVPEPEAIDGTASATGIRLHYPDQAHDAEALLVDPLSGDLYIITKIIDGHSLVFRAAAPLGAEMTLEQVADLALAGRDGISVPLATAADVSPDGSCVYLRTYGDVVAWERDPATPLHEAFAGTLLSMAAAAEPQGEAIAAADFGYWTLSEGKGAMLYRYQVGS